MVNVWGAFLLFIHCAAAPVRRSPVRPLFWSFRAREAGGAIQRDRSSRRGGAAPAGHGGNAEKWRIKEKNLWNLRSGGPEMQSADILGSARHRGRVQRRGGLDGHSTAQPPLREYLFEWDVRKALRLCKPKLLAHDIGAEHQRNHLVTSVPAAHAFPAPCRNLTRSPPAPAE